MSGITVERKVQFKRGAGGRKTARTKPPATETAPERVPRIARLMALAIKFDQMLRSGEVKTLSELAWRYGVSQPRVTQILNLTLLAPEIQEAILVGRTAGEGEIDTERETRSLVRLADWERQRSLDSRVLRADSSLTKQAAKSVFAIC